MGSDLLHPISLICLLDYRLTSKDQCCVFFNFVSLP